eukprot:7598803-Alexandrium_andersonii.AAC.1
MRLKSPVGTFGGHVWGRSQCRAASVSAGGLRNHLDRFDLLLDAVDARCSCHRLPGFMCYHTVLAHGGLQLRPESDCTARPRNSGRASRRN